MAKNRIRHRRHGRHRHSNLPAPAHGGFQGQSPAVAPAATSPSGSMSRRRSASPSTHRWATWPIGSRRSRPSPRPWPSTARSTCWSTNAGITRDRLFVKMTPEDWKAVIDTNLNSMFNVTKQVVPGMIERGWGRIIQISSVNGEKGQAGRPTIRRRRPACTASRWRWHRRWRARG